MPGSRGVTGKAAPKRHSKRFMKQRSGCMALPPQSATSHITRSLSWPLVDIISLCVQNFVPTSELSSLASFPSRICGQWVEALPSIATSAVNQDQLREAVKSLGMSIVARGPQGRAPVSSAVEAYDVAVRAVRSCINHHNVEAFSTLAASIMCLYLSEVSPLLFIYRPLMLTSPENAPFSHPQLNHPR